MITRDLHGMSVFDAAEELHKIIGGIRTARFSNPQDVTLIVGHGPIHEKMFEVYKWYGIEAKTMIGNPGVIVASVE